MLTTSVNTPSSPFLHSTVLRKNAEHVETLETYYGICSRSPWTNKSPCLSGAFGSIEAVEGERTRGTFADQPVEAAENLEPPPNE